jgi:hypothetical protein
LRFRSGETAIDFAHEQQGRSSRTLESIPQCAQIRPEVPRFGQRRIRRNHDRRVRGHAAFFESLGDLGGLAGCHVQHAGVCAGHALRPFRRLLALPHPGCRERHGAADAPAGE